MLAEFRIVPIGIGEESKEVIAKAIAIVEQSELDYQLTAMAILLEGDWEEIMFVIKKCHHEIKKVTDRVTTEIVIDDHKKYDWSSQR